MKRPLLSLIAASACLASFPVCADEPDASASPQVEPTAAPQPLHLDPFGRQMPGQETRPFPNYIYEQVPDIGTSASDFVATPDRWRMFYTGKWYDPYNQNVLKGDIPVFGSPGHEWFIELTAISDTLIEGRELPIPVGFASTDGSNSLDTFGDGKQLQFAENLLMSFSLIRGNTTFKPPEFELRVSPVFNMNYVDAGEDGVLRADPARGSNRTDDHFGFQELFADIHLANTTDRYDFVSSRLGVQQFITDFRGFVYNDNQPGVRLFGNYDNNLWQFNTAWFSRLDKDVNSGINTTFQDRHEDVFIANVFRQDAITLGHQLTASVIHRTDAAGDQDFRYDDNGFLVRPAPIGDQRPKNVSSTYFGFGGDGHFGRVNTMTQAYYVTGSENHNPIANRQVDINAGMFAQEFSYDIDWIRVRASFFWASGDDDPYDSEANGFDTIFDNPNFAGGDLSFWQRQGIPLVNGGGVNLVNRNSLVPDLRASKEQGQANFVNPGLLLYNAGVDFEILPELKLITNASFLQFDQTESLEAVRQDSSIGHDIGYDLSAGILYRPFMTNNVQIRAGVACLLPARGKRDLFGDDVLYDFFSNVILQY